MIARPFRFALVPPLALLAAPVAAQLGQSEGYKFLQAIKDSKNNDVVQALEQPGVTVVNTRDITSGDGALHIVARRGDLAYLNYLLSKDADPNLKNGKGETPLMIAVGNGRIELVQSLIRYRANVNIGSASGETPLILAVKRQDPNLDLIRALLDAGADLDKSEYREGKSARIYAHENVRNPALIKMIDEAPKKAARAVSGPTL